MKRIFLPMVAARMTILGQKTIFFVRNDKKVVEAPQKLIQQLIALCDGTRSVNQIVDLLKKDWDKTSVRNLINGFRHNYILVDRCQFGDQVWNLVRNPTGFPLFLSDEDKSRLVDKAWQRQREKIKDNVYTATVTPYGKLLKNRRSIRSFSGDVPLQSIINMLWSAYGETNRDHRTVPSAGALYPIKIHVALFHKIENLEPAIYSVCFGPSGSVGLNPESTNINSFLRSFMDPMILEGACGVIVISGSFSINAEKYGSRSMLFVPLEAGHIAQNINVSAIEHGIATVEIGGFKESLIEKAINLPHNYHPLITTVFGRECCSVKADYPNKAINIHWDLPVNSRYCPEFSIASARLSEKRSWSHGRDASPSMAYVKAVAEAKEWASCGCVSDNIIQARFNEIKNAVDPRSVIKFHSAQYRLKHFPFKPFDENAKYEWIKGYEEITGAETHLLADLVYFPYFPKNPYYAYANSSGVAAHPDRQKAVETSVLELVERDSFMIAYLTRIQLPTIDGKTLPISIKERVKKIQKAGFKVWIKDHSFDLAPAVCVIAQSEEFECMTCASCSSFNIEYATSHALMEVEAVVLARFQNGKSTSIKPFEVSMPLDHGRLYDQKRYFHRSDFLMKGRKIAFDKMGTGAARSWQELLDRFAVKGWQLFTIPLYLSDKYGGNGNLHIIRSIIPGMVPMTFGYRQEPAGMERIYEIARMFGNCKLLYRELTKFPHPFA